MFASFLDGDQGWISYAVTHVPMCFFVYFEQLLSGLSLIVGFFKNSGIVIVFRWLFQKLEVDKARNAPILSLI